MTTLPVRRRALIGAGGLVVLLGCLALRAEADAIELPPECPPGQELRGQNGCPGHGGGGTCGWARCTADADCGAGHRCVQRAVCFRDVELRCWRGDARAPRSEGVDYTMTQRQRGEACDDTPCADDGRCERFGECADDEPEPEPVAEPEPAAEPAPAPTPPATESGWCATSPGRRAAVPWALALGLTPLLRRPRSATAPRGSASPRRRRR